jgi:acyl-coenzyme A thioesterase PaaI-like protein
VIEGVPAVFQDYLAGLEEQPFARGPGDTFYKCFGCSPEHPSGLRVRCFKREDEVVAPLIIAARYEGPPGAAHGGIVAAYLDEVLGGAVIAFVGRPGLTGALTVRYRKPVPTESPLLCRARGVKDHGRYVDVEGAIEQFPGGAALATATGRFFPVAR